MPAAPVSIAIRICRARALDTRTTQAAATPAPLPPLTGALLLLLTATIFASNHVAARLAFDHGTSVATAVAVRSATTVIVVLCLLRATGTSLRLPRATLARAFLIGLLLSVQSYCLYAAVARLPVALALLTFNTFPLLLAAISWLIGGQRPGRRTLIAMPVILLGLTLALNVLGIGAERPGAAATGVDGGLASHWSTMSAGVGFALTASTAFALALYLTTRWLGSVDGRLRAMLTMATVGVVVLVVGALAGMLGLALLSILYTTAFTTLFALLPRLGAVNNAPILNFEPIAALILASQILGQQVLPIQIGGALLVIGAIVFLTTGPRR